ncbi:hypothetical protein F7646_12480, partial [Tenacibaculum finnmarkense genomovar finnmarkense]|uniref:T9SS type B sorting domain-containing protein n=3 Tax=Tenacibaculum finnmarkense TaxID=2781243 RepID=UPI00187B27FB
SGTYEVTYEICENGANPANCKSNTATVLVENPLVANIDDFTGTPLTIGDPSPSVIADDTLDGAAVVIGTSPGQVTLSGTTVPSEVTLNADGTITVNAGAPSGTYEVTYEICENGANPANCKSNTATVLVENLLLADNDTLGTALVPLASGVNPVAAGSVLTGDTLNGVQVTTVNTDITPVTSGNILIDADGNVTIAANTPTGFYPVIYTICENVANPANCTEATVTVEVVGELVAVADKFTSINGKDGATTVSVLENDTLNGEKVIPSEITLTAGTAPTPTSGSITMNADGSITIAPGTTAGTYDYEYTICENLNPANCSTVTSKVVVEAAPIEAVKDEFTSINGKDGATTTSVLENDTLNGKEIVPSEVTLTVGTAPTPIAGSILMNTDGTITIARGTTAGTYDYEYTICENLNPANCKTVTSTVEVVAAPIEAVADTFTSINGKEGNITTSVLENDKLNGKEIVPSEITLTAGTAPTPTSGSITMNADGNIIVAPGTTAGTYDYEYTICEKLNPVNCKTVTSTVEVVAAPIVAEADTFTSINGKEGDITASVLENDTLNGKEIVPSEVTLTVVNIAGGLTLNDDGTVTVPPNTPAGTYQLEYSICEKLNPTNCSTVISEVVVIRAPTATNDSSTGNTPGDDISVNLLTDDTLSDASSITDPATQVTIDLDPTTPGVQNTLDVPNQGTWTVDPATGILTFNPIDGFTQTPTDVVYTLTETSTGLSDTATVKAGYTEVDPIATDDTSTGNTPGDDISVNVLTDDSLSDGTAITNPATQVTIDLDPTIAGIQNTIVVANQGVWTVNPATGVLIFSPDIGFTTDPTGIIYELTETSTGLSDTATVIILLDTDSDGIPNVIDIDDDNDGILDTDEGDGFLDTDNDGIPDSLDTDSDNDGVVDIIEGNDADADGIPDAIPTGIDTDLDGLDDAFDTDNGGSPVDLSDTDGDGIYDYQDIDDDNDGINTEDENPGDTNITTNDSLDTNENGIPDSLDTDTNKCGTPYNIMTPDNDGENDSFFISCIDKPEYSKNTVEIFNRWGNTVYKASGYDNESVSFKGISNGRSTISVDEKLPPGTYYYVIDLGDGSKPKVGWLYINR